MEIKKEIEIPEGVEINIEDKDVKAKGPKGELSKNFSDPRFNTLITIEKNQNIIIKTNSQKRKIRAMIGTIHSHIKNMISGVTIGFEYILKITYSHFPIAVSVKDSEIQIRNFLGEKGARKAKIIGDIKVEIKKDEIILNGIDIENLGQTAANIEQACRVSKRDRRIFQDGIFLSGRFLQSGEAI